MASICGFNEVDINKISKNDSTSTRLEEAKTSKKDGKDEANLTRSFSLLEQSGVESADERYSVKGDTLYIPSGIKSLEKHNLKVDKKSIIYVKFEPNSNFENFETELFRDYTELKRITIPASTKVIESGAFHSCSALEEVIFEEGCSLEKIGKGAFSNCRRLTSILIPKSVSIIEGAAFLNCSSLRKVIFEKNSSLRKICTATFQGCSVIKSVSIPHKVWKIGKHAFAQCVSLRHVTFVKECELEWIGQYAFTCCVTLQNIEIPTSVSYIGYEAFANCKRLKEINFENNKSGISHHQDCLKVNSSVLMEAYLSDSGNNLNLSELHYNETHELTHMILKSSRLQNSFNEKYCSIWPVFVFFHELYVYIALVYFFITAAKGFSSREQIPPHIFVILYILAGYLFLREFVQLLIQKSHYILWSAIDILRVTLTAISVVVMKNYEFTGEKDVNLFVELLILLTGFLVIINLVLYLRISNQKFARFVGGVLQIMSILGPFVIVSFVLLLGFAFMYHIVENFDRAVYTRVYTTSEDIQFSTLHEAFVENLLFFALEPGSTGKNTLDFLVGLMVAVILLNGVIIAVVNDEWNKGGELIHYTFWKYRICFLSDPLVCFLSAKCQCLPQMFDRLNQFQNRSFLDDVKWYKNPYDKLNTIFNNDFQHYKDLCYNYPTLDDSKNHNLEGTAWLRIGSKAMVTKLDPKLPTKLKTLRSWQRDLHWVSLGKFNIFEIFILLIQFGLHVLCIILGPVTFGLTWDERIRVFIFSHTMTEREIEDESIDELHTKVHNLEKKVDKIIDILTSLKNEH